MILFPSLPLSFILEKRSAHKYMYRLAEQLSIWAYSFLVSVLSKTLVPSSNFPTHEEYKANSIVIS